MQLQSERGKKLTKHGYVEIDSHEGKEIVKFYCGGN